MPPIIPDTPLTRQQAKNREGMQQTYLSPRISTEVPDCGFPMTFDQYNRCAYNCSYCFATQIKVSHNQAGEDFQDRNIKSVNPESLERILSGNPKGTQEVEIYNGFIRYKIPFHWGGLTDPFDRYEKKFGVGLQVLSLLKQYEYPTFICFKGDTIMLPEYRHVIKDATNFVYQISLAGLDPKLAARIDKGAPPPLRRLEIMKKLTEMGKRVYWRYRPFVLGWSDLHMDELFRLVDEACDGNCEAVSVEWMALSSIASKELKELYDDMSKHLGYDVLDYGKRMSRSIDSYTRCNPEVKKPHFLKAWELARQYGMSYAVSDPHFKELNDSCNCCGVPKTDPILGSYTIGQQTEAVLIAKRKGFVTWTDMARDAEWAKEFMQAGDWINFGSAKGHRKHKNVSMYDYLRDLWNDPKAADSPYRYFWGKLRPRDEPDEHGDLIYDYVLSDYEKEDPRFTDTSQTQKNCASCGACGFANTAYVGEIGEATPHQGDVIDIAPSDDAIVSSRAKRIRKQGMMYKLFGG